MKKYIDIFEKIKQTIDFNLKDNLEFIKEYQKKIKINSKHLKLKTKKRSISIY